MSNQEYSSVRRRWIIGDIFWALGVGLIAGIIIAQGRLEWWPSFAVVVVLALAVFIPRGIGWKRTREKLENADRPDTVSVTLTGMPAR
jgi:membrane protein YdbS with pleckstrin-like domain